MRNESVAVLDIRSYEVTFLLGGKGVNGTFVFRGSKSEEYDGFSTEGFFDYSSLCSAISSCMQSVLQNYDGEIRELYVGVPSALTKIYTKGQTISFPSKRKLSEESFDALFEAGLSELAPTGRYIHRSAMYFSLGDNRKYFTSEELYGAQTSLLEGALCYYFISDEFYSVVQSLFEKAGFTDIHFVPQTLAQANYLIPQKAREGYAFLLDVGFLTSSISVLYGNGIVHEKTFDGGKGQVLCSLMENLGVEYEKAMEILFYADVSGGTVDKEERWTDNDGRAYSVSSVNDTIKFGLDGICENVDSFFSQYYRDRSIPNFAKNPLSMTGEGIVGIKGGTEHISKRLGHLAEVVAPEIPYYDKPTYSSRISILFYALSKREKKGWKGLLFKLFGGRRK